MTTNNPTNTNQASEDDDIVLRRILFKWAEKFNDMGEPNEGQDGWYITYDKYMDSFTKEVQSLIRTEKLKLLAEVRERVVGGLLPKLVRSQTTPEEYIYPVVSVSLIEKEVAKRLDSLDKLEAEL